MLAATIAAFASAALVIHLKWFLRTAKIETRQFMPVYFILLFVITSLLVPTFGGVDLAFLAPKNLVLFAIMLAVGLAWNHFHINGLRRETLHEYELNKVLFPIFSITLAALAFADEREPVRLALAGLAVLAFLSLHFHHKRLSFKQADRWMVFAVFLMAMELSLYKPLLTIFSPVTLYALRTGLIALIFFFAYRPELRRLTLGTWVHVVFNAGLGVTTRIFELVAISQIGVVVTQLFFLLSPITLAVVSFVVLRERWTLRQGLALAVILGSIVTVTLLSS